MDMLEDDSKFLNMNKIYNCCKTYHILPPMAMNGFLWFLHVSSLFWHDSLAVPLGPLWFLPPLKKFLVQTEFTYVYIVILTVGDLASNTSNMNQRDEKRTVLVIVIL